MRERTFDFHSTLSGLFRKLDESAEFGAALSVTSSVEPMSPRSGLGGNAPILVLEVPALLPLRGGAC